jgi:histidine ammonia-lyase
MKNTFKLGDDYLTIDLVESIVRGEMKVCLSADRRRLLDAQRRRVELRLTPESPPAYGINTGFGALAEMRVSADNLNRLQTNLIQNHCTGVGEPFSIPITRAIMLLRAQVLAKTTSGARATVVDLLIEMLNLGIHPLIPSKGSVGASGDLAPLAHLALALIGEGNVRTQAGIETAASALAAANLTPVSLEAKEGLALINGTQAMTADLALTLARARRLVKSCDIVTAMSAQALMGSAVPSDARIHRARPQHGQQVSAHNISRLMKDSPMVDSHADCEKVQDPYSLRCAPQVHGASRNAVVHACEITEIECNSATDNPLIFADGPGEDDLDILSGGNFHGQPIALIVDYCGIALAELANISERRIEQLVNPALSSGLPPFLSPNSGLNSGFMIAQVTAAALVSENKVLAHPASVDSIPSSANREDHVSMGTIAARKARVILEHVETVIGIELMCSTQGIDLRRPLTCNAAVEAAHAVVRKEINALDEDRFLQTDIESATRLVRSGEIVNAVESVMGNLDETVHA